MASSTVSTAASEPAGRAQKKQTPDRIKHQLTVNIDIRHRTQVRRIRTFRSGHSLTDQPGLNLEPHTLEVEVGSKAIAPGRRTERGFLAKGQIATEAAANIQVSDIITTDGCQFRIAGSASLSGHTRRWNCSDRRR